MLLFYHPSLSIITVIVIVLHIVINVHRRRGVAGCCMAYHPSLPTGFDCCVLLYLVVVVVVVVLSLHSSYNRPAGYTVALPFAAGCCMASHPSLPHRYDCCVLLRIIIIVHSCCHRCPSLLHRHHPPSSAASFSHVDC